MKYVIGIDQSTQGTKAVLFDRKGSPVSRAEASHRQLVNEQGWVSHDPEEIYQNVIRAVGEALAGAGVSGADVAAVGICNQRETTVLWDGDGVPLADAVVWQCSRAAYIADRLKEHGEAICGKTGLPLSAYFPAAKMAWLMEHAAGGENTAGLGVFDSEMEAKAEAEGLDGEAKTNAGLEVPDSEMETKAEAEGLNGEAKANAGPGVPDSEAETKAEAEGLDGEAKANAGPEVPGSEAEAGNSGGRRLHFGTIDSWLIYRLTGGSSYKTDYSNASRTQLFNLHTLCWDEELCRLFGIPMESLPQVCDSDSCFGYTDFEGLLKRKIPICGVMGDSHSALYGQGCHERGMVKTTYGTGSSIMMNTGEELIASGAGLAASLAWGIDGKVTYVLEGNINYTGAVVTWLKDDMKLISSPEETAALAESANPGDTTVLIPAFTGLSAPYWKGEARAALYGMSRTTGRAEVVKAALESIAYQITDVLKAMEQDSGQSISELRVDGGATKNTYLMQFQSSMAGVNVNVAENAELSVMGAAYLAGITAGICDREQLFKRMGYRQYRPAMDFGEREKKYRQWREALERVL